MNLLILCTITLSFQAIIQPKTDLKQYRYLELENGLKVILIQDPFQQTFYGSLDVKIGSWDEPDKYPGLAHFLEHMLFIGSKKYPKMDYFDTIVAKGAGYSNAFTDLKNTNYFFQSIGNINKTLDVFANFFIDPLFSEEGVHKERNAVNSEYEIDINTEEWKLQNFLSLIAKQDHPARRFTIGNNDVLNKPEIVDVLRQFYKTHYSSNIMAFALQSNLQLDEMEQLTKNSAFNKIKNIEYKEKEYGDFAYEMNKIVKLRSENNQIYLSWQLSNENQYIKTKPLRILDYIISSQHEGSLADYLKKNKYILSIDTSIEININGFEIYVVQFKLSDESIKDKQSSLKICNIVYNYICQIENWFKDENYLKQLFEQYSKISKINFDYSESDLLIIDYSININKYEYEDILINDVIIDKYDKQPFQQFLQELKDLNNLLIIQYSNQYYYTNKIVNETNEQFLQNNEVHQKSELYNLEYEIQLINLKSKNIIIQQHQQIQNQFTKIEQNQFIPESIKIINNNSQQINIINTNFWWKTSTSYQLPKIYLGINYSFLKQLSLQQLNSLQIYTYILNDQLQIKLNQALSIGYKLQINIENQHNILIQIYGYSEKISKIIEIINQTMQTILQNQQQIEFSLAKQKVKQNYHEQQSETLYLQIIQIYLNQLMIKHFQDPQQLLLNIQNLKNLNMVKNIKLIQSYLTINSIAVGNIDQSLAQQISNILKNQNQSSNFKYKIINLKGQDLVFSKIANLPQNDINGATLNYYQIGYRNIKRYSKMKILQNIMATQAFQFLRTDLQLGYMASLFFQPIGCIDGAVVLVQGSKELPYRVDQIIEQFLLNFHQFIQDMTKKEFKQYIESTIMDLQEQSQTLEKEGQDLFEYVSTRDFEFDQKEQAIPILKKMNKKQIIDFFEQIFIKDRRKLSIQLYGQGMAQQRINENFNDFVKSNLGENQKIFEEHNGNYQYMKCTSDASKV